MIVEYLLDRLAHLFFGNGFLKAELVDEKDKVSLPSLVSREHQLELGYLHVAADQLLDPY